MSDSAEYKAFKDCHNSVLTCIKQSPKDVSDRLEILAPANRDYLRNDSHDDGDKARRIMDAVLLQIENNPLVFQSFVSALEAAGSFTKATVQKLNDALQRQNQEQCDQTPKIKESGERDWKRKLPRIISALRRGLIEESMEDDIHIQGLPDEFYISGGPTNELEDFRVRRTDTFSMDRLAADISERDVQQQSIELVPILSKTSEVSVPAVNDPSNDKDESSPLIESPSTKSKITALENQCARNSATISKLMEINRLTSGPSDQGSEIGKLQRAIEKLECALCDKDDELDRVRRQHTDEMSQTMDKLHTIGESYKITALENQCARDSATISKLSMEINRLTSGPSDQGSEIGKLQRAIEKLACALCDKDDELGRVRRQHTDEMSQRMDELRTIRESYEVKIHEYEQLMDLKVQLDQEIPTYRAPLQEEDTRLNLTPTPREKRTRTRTQTGGEPVPIPKKMRLETPTPMQAKKSSVS